MRAAIGPSGKPVNCRVQIEVTFHLYSFLSLPRRSSAAVVSLFDFDWPRVRATNLMGSASHHAFAVRLHPAFGQTRRRARRPAHARSAFAVLLFPSVITRILAQPCAG